jgi:hypothetical protein
MAAISMSTTCQQDKAATISHELHIGFKKDAKHNNARGGPRLHAKARCPLDLARHSHTQHGAGALTLL